MNTPGFSLVAILTLAVGIASNAALFSVYDRLVLNPVTLPEPSSLVAIWTNNTQANFNAPALSWPRYAELERTTKSFSSIALSAFDNFTLTGVGEQPMQLTGLRVSHDFFKTLGIAAGARAATSPRPTTCRTARRCASSATSCGQRSSASAPSIVGETIQLNGQSWQVIGIMPPQLTPPFRQVQVFAPRVFEIGGLRPRSDRRRRRVRAGRSGGSRPACRSQQAHERARRAEQGVRRSSSAPSSTPTTSATRATSSDSIAGNLKPTFYTLLGAVGFVLLIACANVSSLFVGRLAGRHKEIAVRQSLGATRANIVAQFLTESVIFSVDRRRDRRAARDAGAEGHRRRGRAAAAAEHRVHDELARAGRSSRARRS